MNGKNATNKTNRQYKDSVFVDLFANDITAKENFISLYNALHDTNFNTSNTHIENIKLEKILYMNFYNDVSCLINDTVIVLAEHQSTINENMPLRFLQYIGRIYEKIIKPEDRYARKLKKIPLPEFFVFYNGKQDFPIEKTLKLSDAFISENTEKVNLELTVKVLNINSGKHTALLEKCPPLREYSDFIEIVRYNIEKDPENGFTTAIQNCVKNNILNDYLQRKSKEVMNMLLAEYSYSTDIQTQREEGKLESKLETARKMKSDGFSSDIIAKYTGLTRDEIEKIQA